MGAKHPGGGLGFFPLLFKSFSSKPKYKENFNKDIHKGKVVQSGTGNIDDGEEVKHKRTLINTGGGTLGGGGGLT